MWQPFKPGSFIRVLIDDRGKGYADFVNNPNNWYSETGAEYSETEMKSLWTVIKLAQIRVESFYRVSLGLYPAYNPRR